MVGILWPKANAGAHFLEINTILTEKFDQNRNVSFNTSKYFKLRFAVLLASNSIECNLYLILSKYTILLFDNIQFRARS